MAVVKIMSNTTNEQGFHLSAETIRYVDGRLLHMRLHHHPAYWRPPRLQVPRKQTIWLRHLSLVLAQPPDPIGGQTGPEGGDRCEGDAGPGGGGHLPCLSRHLAMVGAPA